MRNGIKRAPAAGMLLLLILLLALPPAPVLAAGVGVSPTQIEIVDAFRGNEYQRTITVFNPSEHAGSLSFKATGEIADWVTFHHPDDPDTPVETIDLPAMISPTQAGSARVLARFLVPDDAANRPYTGVLYAETGPLTDGTGEQTVSLQVPVPVTISVTGTQILLGEVERIEARNTEIGLPLIIQVTFANKGNVVARPEIDVAITIEDQTVGEFSYSDTEVRVDGRQVIEMEWDTAAAGKTGDYIAQVSIALGGENIRTSNVPFKIFPRGGLAAQGRMVSLSYEQPPALRTMAKIMADFENTGPVDVSARLVAEVYRDGTLVDIMESEEWLITAGEDESIPGYYRPDRPGEYVLRGHVAYGGKRTATQDLSFTIAGGSGGVPIPVLVGVGVAAAVVAYMVLRRRKRRA